MRTLRWSILRDQISVVFMCFVLAFDFVCRHSAVVASAPNTKPREITSYACENGLLLLECQQGEVIRILRANYGRFTLNVCNRHGQTEGWNVQCRFPKSKEIISRRCDGHQRCEMRVNNHVFEDPCPATSKYAEVKYVCELAPAAESTTVKPTSTKKPDAPYVTLNQAPEPPVITSVRAISSEDIEVNWTQVPPKHPVITTTAYYLDRDQDLRPVAFFSKSNHSLIIKDLRPNTMYEILLRSVNEDGFSASSNVVNVMTLPEAEPSKPPKPPIKTTPRPVTVTTTTTTTTKKISTKKPEPQTPDNNNTDNDKYPNKDETDIDGNVRVNKFCPKRKENGILWPKTRYGRVAEQNCPKDLKGTVTWRCFSHGWDVGGPDLTDCMSAWLMNLDEQVQSAMEGKEPADEAASDLSEAMETKAMTPGDLKRTATKLLPKLRQGIQNVLPFASNTIRRRRIKKFKKAFMRSSSLILSHRQAKSWRQLSRRDRQEAATSLVLAIEGTGFQTASVMDAGSSDVTVDDNIVMEVNVVNTDDRFGDLRFPSKSDLDHSQWQGTSDQITIPKMNIEFAQERGLVNVVFTMYKNMKELIQPQVNTVLTTSSSSSSETNYDAATISDDSHDDPSRQSSVIINTNIISASINSPKTKWKLPEPIRFTLHHLQAIEKSVPMCSFWDIDSSAMTGSWSQDGCHTLESNATQTTCECDHLTNFAVLMDVSGIQMLERHEIALQFITYVGCIISIVCLMLAWITFMVFKSLQCDRNTIHKNLVLCLMLAEIVFLAGIAQTEYKMLCSIIAGVLHYLFLGAFAWMCLEGVQLYVMLIEVFELEKSRVKWYYLFGYGVPLLIVGITAAIRYQGYGTERHCWLSSENYFIWSFVGPALAVVLINCGMLSIAIYTMCRHSNMSTTMKERTKATKVSISETYCSMETYASPKLRFPEFPAWLKGAVVLVVLLGLTWGLGVLYLNKQSIVMAYAFTILNSLQGLFIYVFHCLMNEKVQKEYRKVARHTSWLPDCIRVNYGGYAGVTTSSQNNSSGSGNIFSKFLGPKRRKQSATSTNSSMKPFLQQDQHRRSSTENSSSHRDSGTVPTSLNGYVYKPHYNDDSSHSFTNNNGSHKLSINGRGPLEPCYETVEGLTGDLSECIDCSIVDSEMVTEYCRDNMKVSQEQRRYSTGSENSDYERPEPVTTLEIPCAEADGLSNLSCNSSLKQPLSSFVSTSEVATGSNLDLSEDDPEEDQRNLDFHLEQYIIPTRPLNELTIPSDQKSSSMNKLNKPAASSSSIPETNASQHHASSPNIQFRPGFSTAVPPPNHVLLTNQGFEESNSDNCASPSSEVSSPSSVKSSLPNISFHTNSPLDNNEYDISKPETLQKRRPSSEADMDYNFYQIPSSDC